ncbi:MAG: carboxymuconolactone decarboxylase family protein [Magnetospirillum sp.]|jgi:uncharacterized peroxidase-related enzyme|nr:carboxymuconolactone decarboxylase family protein [Magnetospirillum sp.]
MSRIAPTASIEASPAAAQASLKAVNGKFGSVPNLFRVLANAPAALDGYLGFSGALGAGTLDLKTREAIALTVAEANGCGYCLAAHSYIAANMAKIGADDIAKARAGHASDAKTDAALVFAKKIVEARGHVGEGDLAAVRGAGFDNAAILEIVANVALNTLTNYVNEVAATPVDFPAVKPSIAA